MRSAPPPTLFATGFVSDRPEEGTNFPSAGGNSGNPKVQAIYWRCLVALFASARISNPDQRLALFCNVPPPQVDGIEIAKILAQYRVEVRLVPLTARLAKGRTAAWGNVLYFFDILASLEDEPADLRFALVDSDVLVTAPLTGLFGLLDNADYAGYVVDSAADESINGLSRSEMGEISERLAGSARHGPIDHYGGELFVTSLGSWRRDRRVFHGLLDGAESAAGPAAGILTEEHIFSIGFALLDQPIASASQVIKRIWTSPRHNTARAGDEALPIWHLPAEKRYGLNDLFRHLARNGFPTDMAPDELHGLAMRFCGVSRKSFAKIFRDGIRQVAAKLGLRQ